MLTTDSKERKETPMYTGLLAYFPNALAAVARHSFLANEKHNPGEPVHWAKDKSNDHLDCLARHLVDSGVVDPEFDELHDVAIAWRALANLEVKLGGGPDVVEEAAPVSDPIAKPPRLKDLELIGGKGPILLTVKDPSAMGLGVPAGTYCAEKAGRYTYRVRCNRFDFHVYPDDMTRGSVAVLLEES